jgi:hypothetical protein
MVTGDGGIKLMDLGLAKSAVGDVTRFTQSGFAMGTPHYMAPEQLDGRSIDIRSDIYSLGATLYHMVTGAAPFRGMSPQEIVRKQLRHELEDPRSLNPDLSGGICHVIEKALARDPNDRYPSPVAMAKDLTRVVEGRSPETRQLKLGRSVMRRSTFRTKRRAPRPRAWYLTPAGQGLLGICVVSIVIIIFAFLQWKNGDDPPIHTPPPPIEPPKDKDPVTGPHDLKVPPEEFLTEKDLRTLGLMPAIGTEPVTYEKYGKGHVFRTGQAEEMEVHLFPHKNEEEARAKYDQELRSEKGKKEASLGLKRATLYKLVEVKVIGDRSWVSLQIRVEGHGIAKIGFRWGRYVVKVLWAEAAKTEDDLERARVRAMKAANLVLEKIKN